MQRAFAVGALLCAATTCGPARAAGIAAPIPDLSGQWGRNWFFFESPPSGPGPITSKVLRPDGTMETDFVSVGDYRNPILKPEAGEVLKKRGEMERSGHPFPSAHTECRPEPPPFVLGVQSGVLITQQADKITLVYLADQKVRQAPLNAPHPAHITPSPRGDSVGHFENGTLVIDTVGIKTGSNSMVDFYGTPHSQGLHVIERYRLIDGVEAFNAQRRHEAKYFAEGESPLTNEYGRGTLSPDPNVTGLQVEITVEDPGVFNTPWTAVVTYRRLAGDWPEAVCAENISDFGPARDLPTAAKPDF